MIQPWTSVAALAAHMAAIQPSRTKLIWPPDKGVRVMTTREFRQHLNDLAALDKRKLREFRRELAGL